MKINLQKLLQRFHTTKKDTEARHLARSKLLAALEINSRKKMNTENLADLNTLKTELEAEQKAYIQSK